MRQMKILLLASALAVLTLNFAGEISIYPQGLDHAPSEGEAYIWYLGHAGWAVKTKNHLLVFDYLSVSRSEQVTESPPFTNGYIDPAEIKACDVIVFVSHGHGDHFDPKILDWEKTIEKIRYIFGWEADKNPRYYYLIEPRTKTMIDDVVIFNVNHAFDGIPEAAFMVKTDGLTIFHSGDHGSVGEEPDPLFKANIDFLAGQNNQIDLAFIAQFGGRDGSEVNTGDLYTIDRLKPQVTFPMHQGGGERFYKRFAQEMQEKGAKTKIYCAEKQGDRFFYRKGK